MFSHGTSSKTYLQIKDPKYVNSFIFIPHYPLRNQSGFNYNRYQQTFPDGDLSTNRTPRRCDSMDTWKAINNTDEFRFPNRGEGEVLLGHKTTTGLTVIFPILFLLIPWTKYFRPTSTSEAWFYTYDINLYMKCLLAHSSSIYSQMENSWEILTIFPNTIISKRSKVLWDILISLTLLVSHSRKMPSKPRDMGLSVFHRSLIAVNRT